MRGSNLRMPRNHEVQSEFCATVTLVKGAHITPQGAQFCRNGKAFADNTTKRRRSWEASIFQWKESHFSLALLIPVLGSTHTDGTFAQASFPGRHTPIETKNGPLQS